MPKSLLLSAAIQLTAIEVKDLQKPIKDFTDAAQNVQNIVSKDITPQLVNLPAEELDAFRAELQKLNSQLISSYRAFQETKRVVDSIGVKINQQPAKEQKEGVPPETAPAGEETV